MDKKLKFAQLVAKMGVFFGSVDGDYSDKEKAFVNLFVGMLKAQFNINESDEKILTSATEQSYKLQDIIEETQNAVKDMSADEKSKTFASLENFINIIIGVDGEICEEEKAAFAEWKKAFNLK